jgi:hypothetical protein
MPFSFTSRASLWLGLAFLLPVTAWANCGLSNCTREISSASGWSTYQSVKTVSFQRDSFSGSYVSWTPQMRWQATEGWSLGAFTSAVSLHSNAQTASGLGNIVLFGEIPLWFSEQLTLGTQVELPSAQNNTGLSSTHTELMPYVLWKASTGFGYWFAKAGARFSVGETGSTGSGVFHISDTFRPAHADHDHVQGVEAFPHTDREVLGQVGFGWLLGQWTVAPYASGYYSLVNVAEQSLSAGTRVDWTLNPQWTLSATAEWPITIKRRENSAFGLWVSTAL